MKNISALLLCIILFCIQSVAAQPTNPIVNPLPGELAFWTTDGFIILNTETGEAKHIQDPISSTIWSPNGEHLFTFDSDSEQVILLDTEQPHTDSHIISYGKSSRNATNYFELYHSAGWAANNHEFMFNIDTFTPPTSSDDPLFSLHNRALGTRFEILDTTTGTSRVVFNAQQNTPVNFLFPDETNRDVLLQAIVKARWNPVYTDWVMLISLGIATANDPNEEVTLEEFQEAGLFNYVTNQYISFSTLFPQDVISGTDWSADGRKIAMNTMTGISVVSFTLQDGNPILKLVANDVQSRGQAVLEWLGAGDLLITAIPQPYRTSFMAQAIDGKWYSSEFIALDTPQYKYSGGTRDFHLTATGDERNRISCMFFDQARPPHLQPNQRGQVTFTDGTPSRLRATPSTQGEVIAQMQEGTSFETVGDAYCVDDYRWWQVRLDDGTTGWAAEGSQSEFWIEPIN